MRFHLFHPISTFSATFPSTPRVYSPGEVETALKTPTAGVARTTPKEDTTTMTDPHIDALQKRYRTGYTGQDHEGTVTLSLFGTQSRHYRDVTVLTRNSDHPHPDTAAPAVVLARNEFGIAVVELFDPPTERDTVVDLAAERNRRRGATTGAGA